MLPRSVDYWISVELLAGENVDLIEYDCSPSGLIQSINDRFPNGEADDIVQLLWEKDAKHF